MAAECWIKWQMKFPVNKCKCMQEEKNPLFLLVWWLGWAGYYHSGARPCISFWQNLKIIPRQKKKKKSEHSPSTNEMYKLLEKREQNTLLRTVDISNMPASWIPHADLASPSLHLINYIAELEKLQRKAKESEVWSALFRRKNYPD